MVFVLVVLQPQIHHRLVASGMGARAMGKGGECLDCKFQDTSSIPSIKISVLVTRQVTGQMECACV